MDMPTVETLRPSIIPASASAWAPPPRLSSYWLGVDGVDFIRTARRGAKRGTALEWQGVGVIVTGIAYRVQTLADGGRHILNILLPGDTFGLDALLGRTPLAVVQAASDVQYLALSRPHVQAAIDDALSSGVRLHLLRLSLDDTAAREAHMAQLAHASAEQRMAHFLTVMHGRLLACGMANEHAFSLPFTQREIGEAVGMHVIRCNQVLQRLRGRKLAYLDGRTFTITDPAGLAALALL